MRELEARAKAIAEEQSAKRSDSTGSADPGTKSKVQKKEEKARGKVQEILRESWSERAVVGSMAPISGLADDDSDGDDDDVFGDQRKGRDEVEMHHQRKAHADVAAIAAAAATPERRRSRGASPVGARPLSPRNVPLPPGGAASPGAEDVGRLGGIEQRVAALQ